MRLKTLRPGRKTDDTTKKPSPATFRLFVINKVSELLKKSVPGQYMGVKHTRFAVIRKNAHASQGINSSIS